MLFSVQDAQGREVFRPFRASSVMALAFHLLDLEEELELTVTRNTAHPAPEVDAAQAAWSGKVGEFGKLRVRLNSSD